MSAEAQAKALESGVVIAGRYRIEYPLGVGGMGTVYAASHLGLGRPVALKVLHPRLGLDEHSRQRFFREARTSATLEHPNIIRVEDVGEHKGLLYIAMERLNGAPLRAIWGGSPRPAGEVLALLWPVLDAISAAHTKGVVHRDLKPANVVLSNEGGCLVPKVLDFGIAKVSSKQEEGEERLTATHASLGTAAYMAPEQILSARDVTGAADLYALGVILFEGLSGTLPHEGENYNQIIIARATAPPRQLIELRPELDPALAKEVMRCLEVTAEDRFASIEEMKEALSPWLSESLRDLAIERLPDWITAFEDLNTHDLPATMTLNTPRESSNPLGLEPTQDADDGLSTPMGLVQSQKAAQLLESGLRGRDFVSGEASSPVHKKPADEVLITPVSGARRRERVRSGSSFERSHGEDEQKAPEKLPEPSGTFPREWLLVVGILVALAIALALQLGTSDDSGDAGEGEGVEESQE